MTSFWLLRAKKPWTSAAAQPPALVVLDLSLPGISGLEVCGRLREWTSVPILVLSARGQERDKVDALDRGADDYLTKPFGMDELLARIRAALRRRTASRVSAASILTVGDVVIDFARRVVTRGGEEVRLTRLEYDVLRYLAVNADRVVTHRQVSRRCGGRKTQKKPSTCASISAICGRNWNRTPPARNFSSPNQASATGSAPSKPNGQSRLYPFIRETSHKLYNIFITLLVFVISRLSPNAHNENDYSTAASRYYFLEKVRHGNRTQATRTSRPPSSARRRTNTTAPWAACGTSSLAAPCRPPAAVT